MIQVDGACLCGAVRFEAEVDPAQVFVCHCSDCQAQSGSAFRTVVRAREGSFSLRSGELRLYEKRAESGRTRSLAFCPECGSSIYGGPEPGKSGMLSLRVGVLRQRAQLRPVAQVWCRSAQPWVDALDALPRIDTQPG